MTWLQSASLAGAEAVDWQKERAGPKSSATILWIGHSLIEHKAASAEGPVQLMSLVQTLAQARGLGYDMTDHTLWGAPLSGLWEGKAYREDRDMLEMRVKREAIEAQAARYDTVVATERIQIHWSMKLQFAPLYLRRFYCAVKLRNPSARVYVYETWPHFQGSHIANADERSRFRWRDQARTERKDWDRLADAARVPSVASPGWLSRFGWHAKSDGGCTISDPIFTIPVGSAFVALAERLDRPGPLDHFERPDGRLFVLNDLVANPDSTWREGERAQAVSLRDPAQPLDDIHLSAEGIYLAALVHFATIYRQSPVGLPAPASLGPDLGKTLQCLAWDVVLSEPRTGVAGEKDC